MLFIRRVVNNVVDNATAETKLLPMVKNVVLTPPDYDRDIRHYEFDIHGLGMPYSPGDCLGT